MYLQIKKKGGGYARNEQVTITKSTWETVGYHKGRTGQLEKKSPRKALQAEGIQISKSLKVGRAWQHRS